MITFDNSITPYITGEKFSSSLEINISENFKDQRRVDKIVELCKGKKVIHIGCVDHIPLVAEKLKNNTWLHKLITEASDKTIGIDINKEGINTLKNDYGISNVIYADITSDLITEIEDDTWDIMVLGEIIEHVDNPIQFLQSIRSKYKNRVKEIYITAPNIMVKNRMNTMLSDRSEVINTDHRFWFTPFTLAKVIALAGYSDIRIDFADRASLNTTELVIRKIKKSFKKETSYPFYYFNSVIGIANF